MAGIEVRARQAAPLAIWALDAGGYYTLVEGLALAPSLGTQHPAQLGQNYFTVGDAVPDLLLAARRALAGERFSRISCIGERWVQVDYRPQCGADGQITGMVAVATDLGRRRDRAARRRARRRQAALEDILTQASTVLAEPQAPDAIFSALLAPCTPLVAQWAFLDLVQPDNQVAGVAAVGPEDAAAVQVRTALAACPGSATPWSCGVDVGIDHGIAAAAGWQWQHANFIAQLRPQSMLQVPLRHGEDYFGLLTFVRCGARPTFGRFTQAWAQELGRRLAQALQNRRHLLATRDALEIRDQFLCIASHETRTPLTSMKLAVQRVQRRLAQGRVDALSAPRMQWMVDQIGQQLVRLERLMGDMLDVTRINTGQLRMAHEVADLGAITREVIEHLRPQLEAAGCTVCCARVGSVRGRFDCFRLEQVIFNLTTNALRYAPGCPVRFAVGEDGGRAFLSVADEGPGIPLEHQQRIFGRFERAITASEVSGLGLGLYIAQQVVVAHGGALWVESQRGCGATFRFSLPLGMP